MPKICAHLAKKSQTNIAIFLPPTVDVVQKAYKNIWKPNVNLWTDLRNHDKKQNSQHFKVPSISADCKRRRCCSILVLWYRHQGNSSLRSDITWFCWIHHEQQQYEPMSLPGRATKKKKSCLVLQLELKHQSFSCQYRVRVLVIWVSRNLCVVSK